jgi:hypothetical protein
MVQLIEQRDVAIDLIKPAPVTMTNLLNLTHTTADITYIPMARGFLYLVVIMD